MNLNKIMGEACSNICDDDPVPKSDLNKVEEAYEIFCDTQINYAIIGVKGQTKKKYQKIAEKQCKEHGLPPKYGFHSSIFVYCSKESLTGYCVEFGKLKKCKDESYYPDFRRFYYHKEPESLGGVRFNRIKKQDYITHKCKEGLIHLKTNNCTGKNFMEKAENKYIFDVKNFHPYTCNCHVFLREAVTALSAKIINDENNICVNNFPDEILKIIQ